MMLRNTFISNRFHFFSVLFLSLVIALPGMAEDPAGETEDSFYTIVQLDSDVESPEEVAQEFASTCDCKVDHVYDTVLTGFSIKVRSGNLFSVMNDSRVEKMSMDRRMKVIGGSMNTPVEPAQSNVSIDAGQELPAGIDRVRADETNVNHRDVNVAVIDTGISKNHPDLEGNLAGGRSFATDDPNDFGDSHGHGTHVAGTIAAEDNNEGVVGVAPEANLYAARVFSSGRGSTRDIIAGIDWVANDRQHPPIDVANMSLGGSAPRGEDPMKTAIDNAVDRGVTFAVAAGNSSRDARQFTPARYDNVITVSAIADSDGEPGGNGPDIETRRESVADDAFAPFSNYGDVVDVTAPGVKILSTWKNGRYNKISGTSMASPHVAGVAALLAGENENLSPDEMQRTIVQEAMDPTGGRWSGDPDGTAEPLADAKGVVGGSDDAPDDGDDGGGLPFQN